MLAVEFGLRHGSSVDAMKARLALGLGATQAQWWRECPCGDWLLDQLETVGQGQHPALSGVLERIVARAIRRGKLALRGVRAEWATAWRRWARRWLSGEDRTVSAAVAIADSCDDCVSYCSAEAAVWFADAGADAAARISRLGAAAAATTDIDRAAELFLQAQEIRSAIPEWDESWEEVR